MPVKLNKEGTTLVAFLSGEIDHHSAIALREAVDGAIKLVKPERLEIDFGDVTFMDSSGVGFVMGRYKLVNFYGGTVVVKNASERVERMLSLSGIEKIALIEKRDKAV